MKARVAGTNKSGLDLVEQMAEFGFLGLKITNITGLRRDLDRHPLHHLQPITLHPNDLSRVVGNKTDLVQSQGDQDLRADAVVAEIRFKAQRQIRFYRILTLILKLVGAKLTEQS